jgi:hypothetical protein
MNVTIKRGLVRDLVEMVRAEGADEAIIRAPDNFGWNRTNGFDGWGIRFPRIDHVFEFFTALGLVVGEDEAGPFGEHDEDEDWFGADDAREMAQRAVLNTAVNGDVIVYFPGVELTGE